MNASIIDRQAPPAAQTPARDMHYDDYMLDQPLSRREMLTRMIKRLNRVLGQYSKDNEERIGRDIVMLIEHGIKKGPHNILMTRHFENKLANGDVLKEIYKSAKNITLEFGMLMHEGMLESRAEKEHNQAKIDKERAEASNKIWVINFGLGVLESLIKKEEYDFLINGEIKETLSGYIAVIRSDINKFCEVHGIKEAYSKQGIIETQPSITAPPSTTSPE